MSDQDKIERLREFLLSIAENGRVTTDMKTLPNEVGLNREDVCNTMCRMIVNGDLFDFAKVDESTFTVQLAIC
jgi:hypothetical protein